MLTINNVTKVFGNTKAVDDVCLGVDKPMMIGIIGASGAGKSTLLRMVNVLETVTEGQISFQGTVISHLSGRAKRRWQSDCAMIFQQFNLVPRLDVVSNVLHERSIAVLRFLLFSTYTQEKIFIKQLKF